MKSNRTREPKNRATNLRYLLMLLVGAAPLFVFFFMAFLLYGLYYVEYRAHRIELTEFALHNTQAHLNNTIQEEEDNIRILLSDDRLESIMGNDKLISADALVTAEALLDIYVQQQQPLVSELTLYLPQGYRLSSDEQHAGQQNDLRDKVRQQILEVTKPSVLITGMGIYFVYPCPAPHDAVFSLKLNKDVLRTAISENLSNAEDAWCLYTGEESCYLSNWGLSYEVPDYILKDSHELNSVTDTYGFSIRYFMNERELLPGIARPNGVILPFILVTLSIVLLLYLMSLQEIYNPIRDAIQDYGRKEDFEQAGSDAFSLLRQIYQRVHTENSRYSMALSYISDDAGEQLFYRLLTDPQDQAEQLSDAIAVLRHPFSEPGRLALTVIGVNFPNAQPASTDGDLYRLRILNYLRDYKNKHGRCIVFSMDESIFVLLTHYDKDFPLTVMEQQVQQIRDELHAFCSGYPFQLYVVGGKTVDRCHKLPTLYKNILLDIYRNVQSQAEHGQNKQDLEHQKYCSQLQDLLQELLDGNSNAVAQIQTLVQEVHLRYPTAKTVQESLIKRVEETLAFLQLSFDGTAGANAHPEDSSDNAFVDYMNRAVAEIHKFTHKTQYRHILRAKQHISLQYRDSMLSIESVSSYLGISPAYFSALFNKYVPEGFVDYLNQYRLLQSQEMLRSSDLSVSEIAKKVGFNSSQNFIRVFRKYFCETPGQYRAHLPYLSANHLQTQTAPDEQKGKG